MSVLFQTGNAKADKYVNAALKTAGVGVLAYLLGEYEQLEEYEECSVICKAIAALMDGAEPPIGGFVWGEELKDWIGCVVKELIGKEMRVTVANMPHYAYMVEDMIYGKT